MERKDSTTLGTVYAYWHHHINSCYHVAEKSVPRFTDK